MKKAVLILAGIFAALLFTYGSLSSLVHQGMSLKAAILVFGAIIVGGVGMLMFLKNDSKASGENKAKE
jgi:hypothetical protein